AGAVSPAEETKKNGNGDENKKDEDDGCQRGPLHTLCHEYFKRFSTESAFVGTCKDWDKFITDWEKEQAEKPRRAMPAAWPSPPFPVSEYQGYPLIGSPPDDSAYPLMKAIYATSFGQWIKPSGIKLEGWATMGGNWSTATNSNSPSSYWLVPNRL